MTAGRTVRKTPNPVLEAFEMLLAEGVHLGR
jgi:hypothetical protein